MTAPLAILFVASFALTAALTPLLRRLSTRVGFLDHPGPRKIHTRPIPYGGGVAVAAGVLAVGALHALLHPGFHPAWNELLWRSIVFSAGSLVILALGLLDDRNKLSPGFKIVVQAVVALGVALGGERFQLFALGTPLEVAATVLWILAVTNAFNLLDHMDGLSTGVAAIAGGAFLIVALQTHQWGVAVLLVPLLGACLGFLPFNFPPARIFLGDAGSLFIGFWLSCLTISFTFHEHSRSPLYTYFVPLAILAVPFFDTASVVAIRLIRRRPIFEGDTNHLAHRLSALGMSYRRAVLTVYALTALAGLSAVLLYHVPTVGAVILLVQLLLTFGIITLLEVSGRSERP